MSDNLRKQIIRLAYRNPKLRPQLLPLLRMKAAGIFDEEYPSNEIEVYLPLSLIGKALDFEFNPRDFDRKIVEDFCASLQEKLRKKYHADPTFVGYKLLGNKIEIRTIPEDWEHTVRSYVENNMVSSKGADRSTSETVVQYAVRELFKGKSPAVAAKTTAKKLSGGTNMFLGPGITLIDPVKLEEALWKHMLKYALDGTKHYTPGMEQHSMGGTAEYFNLKKSPALLAKFKKMFDEAWSHR